MKDKTVLLPKKLLFWFCHKLCRFRIESFIRFVFDSDEGKNLNSIDMRTIKYLIYIFLFSCNSNVKNHDNKINYKIFRQEKVLDAILLHAENNKDSILFLIKEQYFKSCIKKKYIIKTQLSNKTEVYVNKNDTIFFHHEKLDVNDELRIKSGIGKPGKVKNSIYSYRNHPYILHDCSSFSNSANGTD